MGIRKNPEDETYGDQKLAGDAMEMPIGRPLRYTPGLKCDAHLESLRPERAGNHRAIQGGEDWKRKLVQPPNHFDGSFVDAICKDLGPNPTPAQLKIPGMPADCPIRPCMLLIVSKPHKPPTGTLKCPSVVPTDQCILKMSSAESKCATVVSCPHVHKKCVCQAWHQV